MPSPRVKLPKSKLAIALLIMAALWGIYVWLGLSLPDRPATNVYHLDTTSKFLISMSVYIPVLVVWLVAITAWARFDRYAVYVADSSEGPAFRKIAAGLLLANVYLISTALPAAIASHLVDSHFLLLAVAAKNHLPALFSLASFAFIYLGSLDLQRISKTVGWTRATSLLVTIFVIFAAAFALVFVLAPPPPPTGGVPPYALSRTFLPFTLALPYLIAWYFALLASINVARYARYVNGKIYRRALSDLARGLVSIAVLGVVLQGFVILGARLARLGLSQILLAVYALLVLYGVGYIFVYRGAQKLLRLETAE